MYLHSDFYRKRPVELLVGEGIEPEDLNDDSLGSALVPSVTFSDPGSSFFVTHLCR
jgi:hypothetical protein